MNKVPWELINEHDYALIGAIAEKALHLCRELIKRKVLLENDNRRFIEPDPKNIAMDVALYHIRIGVNLAEWYNSNNDAFFAEFVRLQQCIDRANLTVPHLLTLQFANPAKKPQGVIHEAKA